MWRVKQRHQQTRKEVFWPADKPSIRTRPALLNISDNEAAHPIHPTC